MVIENALQYSLYKKTNQETTSYDECGDILYAFADYAKYEVQNCYGIMNRITGEPITRAIYSDINMLSKELFEVQRCDSYDWHLLDTKGNAVSRK